MNAKGSEQVLRIERHNIEMTRGDSIRFTIVLEGRELPEGTKALFTVKDTVWEPTAPVVEKELDVAGGRAEVILDPEETGLTAGDYVWDVRVLEPVGEKTEVHTPMEYGTLRVLEAIGI